MAKILIVDDEAGIRKILRKYSEFEGHTVFEASDGMQAVKNCEENDFDIIIMDVMMPELDGFSAVKEIRKTKKTPVIMLSARGEEYDKVLGFEMGIDDYVVKPFSSKEIMLRVDAILRRSQNIIIENEDSHTLYEKEGLKVDFTARKVFVDDEERELSPKSYELLFYLIENKNKAVSREKMLTEVWGYDFVGDDRTIDTHMKLLRKSLGKYGDSITTLRGLGYRFDG
ncbi:MAG: response regulator transcription factor [Anaerovoracaceae bacterium]